MPGFLGLGISLLISVFISGFFLWIGLKVIRKDRGLMEAGFANLAAGIFAITVLYACALVPLLIMFAPLLAFLAYLCALNRLLKITMLEAFVVSVIASLVFTAVMFLIAGIYLFTIPQPYSHVLGIRF